MIEKETTGIPFDMEAEQAILGSIIEDKDTLGELDSILVPNAFHLISHQYIFKAMLELVEANEPIDEILIGDQLKSLNQLEEIGGYAYLAELRECSPSAGNIVYYAKVVQGHAIARDLIVTTSDIGRKSRDPEQDISDLLFESIEKISDIADQQNANKTRPIRSVLSQAFKTLERVSESKDDLIGLPTGFIDLDRLTLGLIPKDLIIIAGRPGSGKSALALNIAGYLAITSKNNGAQLIISKEMSDEQLVMRMLSSEAKVDFTKLRKGDLDQDDWDKLAMATDNLSKANLHINEKVRNIPEIRSEARKLARAKEGLSLIIIDYLQLLDGPKDANGREQEIAYISRSLKTMAKDFDVPVIALAQLNRDLERRTDKRPRLADLRESGAIEADADIILFIYRDEMYNDESPDKGIAEVICAKHRNGPTGTFRLQFTGKYIRFANLSLQAR